MLFQGTELLHPKTGKTYFVFGLRMHQPEAEDGVYRVKVGEKMFASNDVYVARCEKRDGEFVITALEGEEAFLDASAHPDLSTWANEFVMAARQVLGRLGNCFEVQIILSTKIDEEYGRQKTGEPIITLRQDAPENCRTPDDFALDYVPGFRVLESRSVGLWDHLGIKRFESGELRGEFEMTVATDSLLIRYDLEDEGAYELRSAFDGAAWSHASQITHVGEACENIIERMKAMKQSPQDLFHSVRKNFEFSDAFPGLSSSSIMFASAEEHEDGLTVFHFEPGALRGTAPCTRTGSPAAS